MFGLSSETEIKIVKAALKRKTINNYSREYENYVRFCSEAGQTDFPPELECVSNYLEKACGEKKLHKVQNFCNMFLFVMRVRKMEVPRVWHTYLDGMKNEAVNHHRVPKTEEMLDHAKFVKAIKKIWYLEDSLPKFRVICMILFSYILNLRYPLLIECFTNKNLIFLFIQR